MASDWDAAFPGAKAPASAGGDWDSAFPNAKNAPKQPDGVWEQLKDIGKGLLAGAPNEYSGALSMFSNAPMAGAESPVPLDNQPPPIPQDTARKILGVQNIPQPQTAIGKDVAAGVGAMSNPTSYIGGPESLLARMAIAFGSGALGEQGSQTGQQIAGRPGGVIGGLLGGLTGATAAGAVASRLANSARSGLIPTEEELGTQSTTHGFDTARAQDINYQPQRIEQLQDNVRGTLGPMGLTPRNAGGTHAAIDALSEPGGNRIANLMSLRSELAENARELDLKGRATPNARAASEALDHVDTFLADHTNALPEDQWAASVIGPLLSDARENYSAMRGSQQIGQLGYNQMLNAATSGSGANIENSLRRSIKQILINPSRRRGYSADEISMMERIVEGDWPQNSARLIGKFAATGVIPTAAAGYIGHMLGLPGLAEFAVPAAVGYASKKAGEALVRSRINRLAESVRADSPLGRARDIPARQNVFPYIPGPFLGTLPYSQP